MLFLAQLKSVNILPPKKITTYRPDIDGLRALAVLSVLIYHLNSEWLPGGFVGVDVFFVISGFVVTGSLVGSGQTSFTAFLGEFYARRLARIIPVLIAVLTLSVLASTLFIPEAWLSAFSDSTAKFAFFGLSNWVLQRNADTYFAPRAELNPYTHTWSLGVEEQFYVVVPLLLYLWVRTIRLSREGGVRFAFGWLALLTAASLAGCIWATRSQPLAAFYFIGCRFWELGLGVLLFLITSRNPGDQWTQNHPILRHFSAWLGLALLAVSFVVTFPNYFPWPLALLPTLGTALIIAGARASPKETIVGRMLASAPFVWVGLRSYSLYLWHWPVYVLLRWTVGLETSLTLAIAAIATLALSMLSYRWIELPLRHNPVIEKWPKWSRIVCFLMLPILGFSIATLIFQNRQSVSLSTVTHNSTDWYAQIRMPFADFGDRHCQVKIEAASFAGGQERRLVPHSCDTNLNRSKFIVLGDSHATMLSPLFELLSAEQGAEVSIYSYPGCPFIDFKRPMASTSSDPGCLAFNQAVSSRVVTTSNPGDTVVLSSLRLERYGDQWESGTQKDMYAYMYNQKRLKEREAAFLDAEKWLAPFAEKQLEVIFATPTPVFKAPPFRCSDWFNKANPICIGENQLPRTELAALRTPVVNSMEALSREFSNVKIWDTFPILCPDEICYAFSRAGRPLFFDGDHITAYANLVLYPGFKQMVARNSL